MSVSGIDAECRCHVTSLEEHDRPSEIRFLPTTFRVRQVWYVYVHISRRSETRAAVYRFAGVVGGGTACGVRMPMHLSANRCRQMQNWRRSYIVSLLLPTHFAQATLSR